MGYVYERCHSIVHPSHAELMAMSKKVTHSFSEQDILSWHEEFLTNGFHYINVQDIKTGRKFIGTFLESLNYYRDVGFMSLEQNASSIIHRGDDILEILYSSGNFDIQNLENFIIEDWYYDFVWIEATKQLLNTKWFNAFVHLLDDLSIVREIPIFILSFDKE